MNKIAIDQATSPYRILTSFGGYQIGLFYDTETAAVAAAKLIDYPVDVWSTEGGFFGMGRVTFHHTGE